MGFPALRLEPQFALRPTARDAFSVTLDPPFPPTFLPAPARIDADDVLARLQRNGLAIMQNSISTAQPTSTGWSSGISA